jgi:hypothetical protein
MKRAARVVGLVALSVLTLASFAPVLCLLLAGLVASALDCRLDEGSAHPCLLAGTDIGQSLNTGFVLGWVAFVTWPGMLVSLALWLWLLARRLWRLVRPASGASPPPCAG